MPRGGGQDFPLGLEQIRVRLTEIDLNFPLGGAYVAGDVEVVALRGDFLHRDALGVAILLSPVLVGLDDLFDVRGQKDVRGSPEIWAGCDVSLRL